MSGRRFYLNIRHKISQLLNPALCLSCGIPISSSAFFCADCFMSLERVANPCHGCGQPNPAEAPLCPACLYQAPLWQTMIAPLIYHNNTRKLIHQLKFGQQIHLANALITHLHADYRRRPIQALLPVPLHPSRFLERGFNQSLEIASILSRQLNIALDYRSLQRIKATASQSGLSLNKRRKNISNAFAFNPIKPYRSVAIVDDVITTGSTMREISRQLKYSGVEHIEVWSLARALKHDS